MNVKALSPRKSGNSEKKTLFTFFAPNDPANSFLSYCTRGLSHCVCVHIIVKECKYIMPIYLCIYLLKWTVIYFKWMLLIRKQSGTIYHQQSVNDSVTDRSWRLNLSHQASYVLVQFHCVWKSLQVKMGY
jgi:hypothetical protein